MAGAGELNVDNGGAVAGRVTAGGRAVSDAVVMIVEGHAPHPDIAALTDERGAFELSGLAPGWYNLEARMGTATARRAVELAPGERREVEFDLDP